MKFIKIFLFTILAIFSLGFIYNEAQAASARDSVTVTVTNQPPSGTWSYSSSCPTSCGQSASTQSAICISGNCPGSAPTRTCSATAACPPSQTGTWSYSSSCPTNCGYTGETQTQTCTGGGCSGSPSTRTCSAIAACPTGTWSYSSSCPTACGRVQSNQTQTCTGGNGSCDGSAATRTCSATADCPSGTWSYPSSCPTNCGYTGETQTQTCTGGGCSGSPSTRTCSATATCPSLSLPTASLSASPNPINYNGRSTLTWSSTNATSCTAYGPWSNSGRLSGSGLTNPLTSATTFRFQCTGPGGTSPMQSVTVGVSTPINGSCSATHWDCDSGTRANTNSGSSTWTWNCNGSNGGSGVSCSENRPLPTGNLTATGCMISKGNSTCPIALTWNTFNPIGSSAIKVNSLTVAATSSGNNFPYPSTPGSVTFELWNNGILLGTDSAIAGCAQKTTWRDGICKLNDPKIDSFTATSPIFKGRSSTLTWALDSDLSTFCTGTGTGFEGNQSTSGGSVKVFPIVTTAYTLTCGRSGAPSANKTAIVKVIVLDITEQ